MNPLIKFLAASTGRIVRVTAGVALVLWGLIGLGGATGIVVAVIGAVPLLAGLFDFCVFAPLFGAPFTGPKIRAES
jgi:Inner membrane protein YgaP-like, transmembrane domain